MPRFDEQRLMHLLRLLREAPREWVRRAQRIPSELGIRPPRVGEATTLTARDVEELGRKLERDPSFRHQFDADPVAAAQAAGMQQLGLRLQRDIQELVTLAERVARDDAYRAALAAEPLAVLATAGVPLGNAEPLLEVLELTSEVSAQLADVEAHVLRERPLEERLLLLLLTSRAVSDELRAAARRA
jgi:hypothetical protein